jgi:hypothetical protein
MGRPFGRLLGLPIRPLKAGGSLWMGGKGGGRQALFSRNVEIVCRLKGLGNFTQYVLDSQIEKRHEGWAWSKRRKRSGLLGSS